MEKTLSKIIEYRRKLYSVRMERCTTMTEHVNQLKTISEHLEALEDPVIEKDLVMVWYGMVCRTLPDLVDPSLLLHTSCLYVFHQSFEVPTPSGGGPCGCPPEVCFLPLRCHCDNTSSVHGRTTPMNQTIASCELAINVLIQVPGLV